MYQVTVHHHQKAWRRGDLEDELVLEAKQIFKTRTNAKTWINNQLLLKSGTKRTEWHTGDKPSYAYCFTGETWTHENTGEQMSEYFQYTLTKAKLR